MVYPPFGIADLQTGCAVGVGDGNWIEHQRGKSTGTDSGGPSDLPLATGQFRQFKMGYGCFVPCSLFRLFSLFLGDEAFATLGGAQPARLARNLRIEAVDDVNLLVAAGVYDPLFHV